MKRAAALLSFVLVVVVALALPAAAWAHARGLSAGAYTAHDASVLGTLTFARAELATLLPALDADGDGHVSALETRGARDLLRQRVLERVLVTSAGASCVSVVLDVGLTEGDGLVVQGRWDCPPGTAPFVIDLALLDDLSAGHRHVVGDAVLSADDRRLTLARVQETTMAAGASAASAASDAQPVASTPGGWTFFTMGIEHILTGYDHLVFLLGLVLVLPRSRQATLRSVLAVVTAFTVGHSVSLAVAALGLWSPSPRLVEPAIALSIVYVGVENFFVKTLRNRWRITFPFGLVHGFGLAGALQAIALPRPAIPLALVSFNLGVEAGQLAVLAVLLPVLLALAMRRRRWLTARAVPVLSGAVAVAGGVWFVVRLLG